jgi:hypothetical protein
LGFLSHALAAAPLRRIARSVLGTISDTLWRNVLLGHRFSASSAAQIQVDLAAICRVVDDAVGPGVAESGLRKCLEGARLLGLPAHDRLDTGSQAKAEEAEGDWDAWEGEAEDGAAQDETRASGGDVLGLWDVEKRLFADNESAREVLEELGLETLSETEARNLLVKRVELAR